MGKAVHRRRGPGVGTGELIKGTYYLSMAGFQTTPERALVLRRRLQLLIHSYIYYHRGESLTADSQWDAWAKELVVLQKKYPRISEVVDYYDSFQGFDGSTGFNLKAMTNPEIIRKAEYLLERRRNHGRDETVGNGMARAGKIHKKRKGSRVY